MHGRQPASTPAPPSSSAQVELRQLQAQPELLANAEAFKGKPCFSHHH